MKNPKFELHRRLQRQTHRRRPNWANDGGLRIPHCYSEPRTLSWWDDVGFVLNGRRVMVWWVHPRMKYRDRIEQMAFEAAQPFYPKDKPGLFDNATKIYRKMGRRRKKITGYQMAETPEATKQWYARIEEEEARLTREADFVIQPSLKIKSLDWCLGVELCAPLEIRNKADVRALAELGRRLVKRETTLEQEFPGYAYHREDWLRDQVVVEEERRAAEKLGGACD